MKNLKKFTILSVFFLVLSQTAYAKKDEVTLVNWTNPTPKFSEFNLDLKTVSEIIGKGQLVISHKERDIDLWTLGEIKHYRNVRFSSAMTIINAPADEVRKKVLDTENYGDFMPQIRKSSIPKRENNHFVAHYIQHYNMGPFPIKSGFEWQHTLEEDGDVSLLLHDGDVDAAASRYEFIEVDEKHTLLVLTAWQDLSTAKLTYRMLIKSNADFKAAFPAVAASILLLQYRDLFNGEAVNTLKDAQLPKEPEIPILTDKPDQLKTLIRLAENGTLVLINDKQWYYDERLERAEDIVFASAVRVFPANVEQARPLILDMKSLPEFTKEIKRMDVTDIENGKHAEAHLKIGLGVVGISLDFSFDMVDYQSDAENAENIRLLLNGDGDMYPMLGAYEFAGYKKDGQDYTFGVLTQGGSISEDAPFIVRLIAKKLPQFDFIRTIFSTLPQIEKQQIWVMEQLAKKD